MRNPQRHGVGRPRVGPFPKLSGIRCFCSFSRFRRARTPCRCGCRGGRDTPMGGRDGGTNGCVVSAGALGVSGPQKPKFSPIWVEKRLRNGSETARGTVDFRPRSRPALLLEVINDRGELHCHRTRHRGGRALPVSGCPQGRFPRRSTLITIRTKHAQIHMRRRGESNFRIEIFTNIGGAQKDEFGTRVRLYSLSL
jgi:hypothetical protein